MALSYQTQTMGTQPTPNGTAWAALLSAGIGALGFGILTDLSECSTHAAKLLLWYPPAGTMLIWVTAWFALQLAWKNRRFENQRSLLVIIIVLSLAALITTFPPFYNLIGG